MSVGLGVWVVHFLKADQQNTKVKHGSSAHLRGQRASKKQVAHLLVTGLTLLSLKNYFRFM